MHHEFQTPLEMYFAEKSLYERLFTDQSRCFTFKYM